MTKYKTTRELAAQVASHWQKSRRSSSMTVETFDTATRVPIESTSARSCIDRLAPIQDDIPVENEVEVTWNVPHSGSDSENGKRMRLDNPEVWGSAFWFSLHNGANHYALNASPCVIERTKGFIRGLPLMIPCISCKAEASCYVDSRDHELDEICRTRSNLFAFYVDFHNFVNQRYGKPEMSLEDAKKLYTGYTTKKTMKYAKAE